MSNKKNNNNHSNFENIDKLIDNTFTRLKDMIDANTVIGSTIKLSEKMFVIPISKVSVGLVSGGGEIPQSKKDNLSLTAGSTTGFTITPIGFVTVSDGMINFVGTTMVENTGFKILDTFANIYEKMITKKGVEDEEE